MVDWGKMGIDLSYWSISYKERFKRTIWIFPCLLLLFIFPEETTFLKIERDWFVGIMFALLVIQAIHNYVEKRRGRAG